MVRLPVAISIVLARQIVGSFEPSNPLTMIPVSLGNKVVGIVERADVNREDRAALRLALPCQGRSTLITETTSHTRRGIVNLAVALRELDPIAIEHHNGDDRGTGVPTTAMTMTVPDSNRLPGCLIPQRTAHASAGRQFGLVNHHVPHIWQNHISSKEGCQSAIHEQLHTCRRLAVIDDGIHAERNNPNVRIWLQGDIQRPEIEVCFTPNSGHSRDLGALGFV